MDCLVKGWEKEKVGAVIQARMSSSRLPGKVLLPLPHGSDISVCGHIIRRLKRVTSIDAIIVATTSKSCDDRIAELADSGGVKLYRGSEEDLLARFFEAAKIHQLDETIRLTGDNPCIDCALIEQVVRSHLEEGNDYTVTKQYPTGINVEVLSFAALEKSYEDAKLPQEREHLTVYVGKHPDKFRISEKKAPEKYRRSDIRVTLDTEEDYALLNCVFEFLYEEDNFFGIDELISLYRQKPWLAIINGRVVQKKVFDTLQEELAEAVRLLDLQDLKRAKEILARHTK
jgi:spore coat polysaccharide biosynthesis protein SpsF